MEDGLKVVADKEEIQLAWILVEERNHGMIADKDLIWKVKERNVLLASLWDKVCNLIAGAWDWFTCPHRPYACTTYHLLGSRLLVSRSPASTTYHVLGSSFLVSRSSWAFLWRLGLRRSMNGHERLRSIQITGASILRSVPVLLRLKVPSLRVYILTHVYRCKGSNWLRHSWAVRHWGGFMSWGSSLRSSS